MVSQHNIYLRSRFIVLIYNSLSFQMMFKYKYVSDDFGYGIIVPLVDDSEINTVNSNNSSNSRSITLNPAISKLFELWLIDKYVTFMKSSDVLLGFKSRSIFMHLFLRSVLKYFNNNKK